MLDYQAIEERAHLNPENGPNHDLIWRPFLFYCHVGKLAWPSNLARPVGWSYMALTFSYQGMPAGPVSGHYHANGICSISRYLAGCPLPFSRSGMIVLAVLVCSCGVGGGCSSCLIEFSGWEDSPASPYTSSALLLDL